MGRHVSPSVAYWTNSFEPAIEAVASEVASLRRAFPRSAVWGISPRDTQLVAYKNGLCFHPRAAVVFRAVTAVMQWRFDLNHVFGTLADWHHLRAIWKGPTILTVCLGGSSSGELLGKVDRFAVEWPAARDELLARGIDSKRIDLVYPPVDLERFSPSPPPTGDFTVLFASSPDSARWLAGRGVGLLLEAAALCPRMRFRLVWRPWGDSLAAVAAEIHKRRLDNVEIVCGRMRDMSEQYRAAHVVAAPFLDITQSKPTPNSVLEGMACGRPAVVTRRVGVADLVAQSQAGLVCGDSPESLAECLQEVQRYWPALSTNSRCLAEQRFASERFIADYRRLYDQLRRRAA